MQAQEVEVGLIALQLLVSARRLVPDTVSQSVFY